MRPVVIAFDVETYPIKPGDLAPKVVCSTFASGLNGWGVGNNNKGRDLFDQFKAMLDDKVHFVGHNVAFDFHCLLNTFPGLSRRVWEAYSQGRVHDTAIREKLINLGVHGSLDFLAAQPLSYSLAGIAAFRKIRELDKSTVRVRYDEMDGVSFRDYPREFKDYALMDSRTTLDIYDQQEETGGPLKLFKPESLHVNNAFCLYFSTTTGLMVDKLRVRELKAKATQEMKLSNFPLLVEKGIITPACPGKPYKKNPNKFTKPKPERVNQKHGLMPHIIKVCEREKIKLQITETGRVSTAKTFMEDLSVYDETIKQYVKRQSIAKLVTTYFPAMAWPRGSEWIADTIFPQYDPLKRTGRISSWGNSSKKKNPLYPSVNIQQVDPRVRGCYVPRPGYYFLSADYSALELCCLADVAYKEHRYSKLREQLNQGIDPHTYLGAVLAGETYEEFRRKRATDPVYFKHWRTLAKPVGLGFPGGMGLKTMVKACAGYGVRIDEDKAEALRDTWLRTYPVMEDYLAGEGEEFEYTSSFGGMKRVGCTYTQYMNGRGLQTPGAEGMKLATFELCKNIYDTGSLEGSRFIASIHDEVLLEVPKDKASLYAKVVILIMENAMKEVLSSLNNTAIRVEAALMERWDKRAEPVFENGELVPWKSPSSRQQSA